jgi:hypothetical protein
MLQLDLAYLMAKLLKLFTVNLQILPIMAMLEYWKVAISVNLRSNPLGVRIVVMPLDLNL